MLLPKTWIEDKFQAAEFLVFEQKQSQDLHAELRWKVPQSVCKAQSKERAWKPKSGRSER